MKNRLLIIVNDPAFFLSHRLAVAEGARQAGYQVHVATMSGAAVQRIHDLGYEHHVLPLSRSGTQLLTEQRTILAIWRLLWQIKPNLLHLVTIKPVLYGGVAARLAPVKGVVAAVSGLGFVFVSHGLKAVLLRQVVQLFYRMALGKKNLRVIFQNPDDRDQLLNIRAVTSGKTEIIRGSGVDLSLYQYKPEPMGVPVVCLAARLLRDKGVVEFVEAARLLRQRGVNARFQLVGDADPGNPATVTSEMLSEWQSEGVVELLGYSSDIPQLFYRVHLIVLPSYREGLPKVLVEAAACGRAVVTTDVPGCRDAIEPHVTGLLVPVRDALALANAMQQLIQNPVQRQQMGRAGRELAEREFAIEKVVKQHLDIYRKLEEGV